MEIANNQGVVGLTYTLIKDQKEKIFGSSSEIWLILINQFRYADLFPIFKLST